jgi:hypothetical protein
MDQDQQPTAPRRPELDADSVRTAYEETCEWYHKIDDFRAKLLGFLPFVSVAAVFLLFKNDAPAAVTDRARSVLALMGFVIIIGLLLLSYELPTLRTP